MDKKAKVLSDLIAQKGFSRRSFAEKIGVPATTLQSILSRGVGRASVDNVIKICQTLGITIEEMEKLADENDVETIAAHHDGEDWTEEEHEEIKRFKEFLKTKRKPDHQE